MFEMIDEMMKPDQFLATYCLCISAVVNYTCVLMMCCEDCSLIGLLKNVWPSWFESFIENIFYNLAQWCLLNSKKCLLRRIKTNKLGDKTMFVNSF